MAEIRPLERADLPAVLELLRSQIRGWALDERLFAGLVLDDPWGDEDLPSLVAVGPANEIVGFTGVQVRRMRLDERPIRGVHSGHGVVKPDRRGGAVGALLIGRALSGPQDLTWSDGAIDPVVGVFRTFGGQLDHARACDWLLVLRPVRWLRAVVAAGVRRRPSRHLVPVGALPFQALGPRIVPRAFPARLAEVTGVDATSSQIVESLPTINKRLRLWVDHDEEHLEHLFGLVRYATDLPFFRGVFFCRLVRVGDRPVGWYAYVARPGGASRVLHLGATERHVELVLSDLVDHAREQGSIALAGRAEPHLQWALHFRLPALGYARQPTILAKDPELAALAVTSASLVSRLDGDLFST